LISNTQKLNEILFNTWNELLKSDLTGDKEYFEDKLDVLKNELLKEYPSLDNLNKYIINLLDNNFFKESMEGCYKNHQQKLKKIKEELRTIVTRKKKFKKGLREAYYKINSASLFDPENITTNPERASSRTHLDNFIGYYSNEIFLNDFEISPLKEIVDYIYTEITSETFLETYLENLYGELSRELKSETYSVMNINSLLKEILVELLKKGFVKKDLALNSKSRIPSLDSQLQKLTDIIHSSTGRWTVIVPINGVEFKDMNPYKIGKVKFYNKNTYDDSKLIDAINASLYKREEDKNKAEGVIINFLKDRIIVEAEVSAYGKNGAGENGFLEISKVIDGISLWKSDVTIKEPKFDEICEFIVLNRETGMFYSWNRDPRYMGKVKLDTDMEDFLKVFDSIFNKPYNEYTELEKNITSTLHWYRKGNVSMYPPDKLLNYIIALESLVTTGKDKGSGKKEIISERTIEVIGVLNDYREKYKGKIKKLYDYRSKIVHEGSTNIFNLEDKAKELGKIIEMALLSVAGKIDECVTLEKFLEYNEKERHKKRKDELEKVQKLGIEINKKIKGEGMLKKRAGGPLGKVSFVFEIKDDGKFVVNEVSISSFKKVEGMLKIASSEKDFVIEGNLENIEGKIVIKEIEVGVAELLVIAHKKDIHFHVPSFDITRTISGNGNIFQDR